MSEKNDEILERMNSPELLEFLARIHDAIRAHIRLKNAKQAAAVAPRPAHLPQVEQSRRRSLAVHAQFRDAAPTVVAPRTPPGTEEQPVVGDRLVELERERDAWLARKRSTRK